MAADFREGRVGLVEVQSLWGRECVMASPWPGRWTVRERGQAQGTPETQGTPESRGTPVRGDGPTIRFTTRPGGSYLVESLGQPAEK